MMYAAFTTSFVLLLIKIGDNYDDYEACVAGWAVVQIKKVCMEIQKNWQIRNLAAGVTEVVCRLLIK